MATGSARVRQAYALLRSVMAQAVADGIRQSNPWSIAGAGEAKAAPRPFLPLADFLRIVDASPETLQAALHVALGAHLRLGELVGLQRGDLDPEAGVLIVERQRVVLNGKEVTTTTKTGKPRQVTLRLRRWRH